MTEEYLLVLATCPGHAVAAEIATAVIEQRLAACVNRIGAVQSWFRWNDRLEQEDEVLLLIKTTRARLPALQARLPQLHPYELPELLAVESVFGLPAYLQWVVESTRPVE